MDDSVSSRDARKLKKTLEPVRNQKKKRKGKMFTEKNGRIEGRKGGRKEGRKKY